MAGERMTVKTADGEFGCYVARPAGGGPAPAIVVIQEIFGLNSFVRGTADRLAAQGYLAVAPDLFWRIEPGIDIPDTEMEKAFGYFGAFDVPKGVEDIAATIDVIRADPGCNGKVGAIGFCLGGLLAFLTSTRTTIDAAVSYYGVNVNAFIDEADKISKPLLMHIAGEDGFVPKEAQAEIIAGLKGKPGVEVHVYPGRDHAFARDGGKHYDATDAGIANGRTAAFFGRTIG